MYEIGKVFPPHIIDGEYVTEDACLRQGDREGRNAHKAQSTKQKTQSTKHKAHKAQHIILLATTQSN